MTSDAPARCSGPGRLRRSFGAYAAGDGDRANQLALSAYLDGFEPVEAVLATRDGALMARVEHAMAGFRAAITRGESADRLRARLTETEALLDQAETTLAPEAESGLSTFLGAFAILLREGLEALLVVIAMIAFLRRRTPEALPMFTAAGRCPGRRCGPGQYHYAIVSAARAEN